VGQRNDNRHLLRSAVVSQSVALDFGKAAFDQPQYRPAFWWRHR
jgi:hypothetical protein